MKIAHLWKRVLREGIPIESKDLTDADMSQIVNEIIRAPIIVDTRPRDEQAEEGRPWHWQDFTRLEVPFPTFWLEGSIVGEHPSTWGALVESERKDGRWTIKTTFVFASPSRRMALMGGVFFEIDSVGDLVTAPFNENKVQVWVPDVVHSQVDKESISIGLLTVLDNVLDTMQMLGCKNVALAPRQNDLDEARRAEKRHGPTAHGYRYHVLVVRPPGVKPDSKSQDIGTMPRHLCRGHFVEYGPEFGKGLLFGKLTGRFYVPPHLKGDKKHGIVDKDYAVTAASSSPAPAEQK